MAKSVKEEFKKPAEAKKQEESTPSVKEEKKKPAGKISFKEKNEIKIKNQNIERKVN